MAFSNGSGLFAFSSPSVRTSSSRRKSCRAQSEGWMRHSPPSSAETRRIVHPGASQEHRCSKGGVAFAAVMPTYHTATSKPSWPLTCSLAWFSVPARSSRWTSLSTGYLAGDTADIRKRREHLSAAVRASSISLSGRAGWMRPCPNCGGDNTAVYRWKRTANKEVGFEPTDDNSLHAVGNT